MEPANGEVVQVATTIPSSVVGRAGALGRVIGVVTAVVVLGALVVACQPAIPPDAWNAPVPATGSYVFLQSEPGDSIASGRRLLYTKADSVITVTLDGGVLQVGVQGNTWWDGAFSSPTGILEAGFYGEARRYPFQETSPGLSWTGDGNGCNEMHGWFGVDAITFDGSGGLATVDLRFEQFCDINAAPLHGKVHWDASDPTVPPGPATPGLWDHWRAPANAVPATGNSLYLESDAGEWIGAGHTYLYTSANAVIAPALTDRTLGLTVGGDESWNAWFTGMSSIDHLQPGLYANLHAGNPALGELAWFGEGRGCSEETGWFIIDSITTTGSTLQSIDLRFEQRCGGPAGLALHGQLHWSADDTTSPGPIRPVPAGLWAPAIGTTPATGSYVYLDSDPGDEIGGGDEHLYTRADADLSVAVDGHRASVTVAGDEHWEGSFDAMDLLPALQTGLYRQPVRSLLPPGPMWTGPGRTCTTATGWFAVDDVVVTNGVLQSLDLRFEQHCDGATPALHGQVHWDASDPTVPPGPVVPPPSPLWQAPVGQVPASGSYAYLASESGDPIGGGATTLATAPTKLVVANASGRNLTLAYGTMVAPEGRGDFTTMSSVARIEPGYYEVHQVAPGINPARASMAWTAFALRCTTVSGWFVVDQVSYVNGFLTSIEVRFEQRCDGAPGVLHGQVRWSP